MRTTLDKQKVERKLMASAPLLFYVFKSRLFCGIIIFVNIFKKD